jgi:hypothetical protein
MRYSERSARGFAGLVLASALMAGCGQPEVCGDVDELRQSVDDLQDITIGEDAIGELSSESEEVRQTLESLAEDADEEYSDEITRLRTTLEDLAAAVDAARDARTADSLATVRANVATVGDASRELVDAVSSTC